RSVYLTSSFSTSTGAFGIICSTSAGTVKESATVLPVPESWSDSTIAALRGSAWACRRARPEEPRGTSRRVSRGLRAPPARPRGRAQAAGHPAVHVPCRGKPLDLRKARRNLFWKICMRGEDVKTADGPRVVAAADVGNQLHHFVIACNAVRGELGIDGSLDGG